MKTVNRSEKIRDYLKSVKPSERSPKAVSDALKEKGIKVSPNLVSLVKMKLPGNTTTTKKKAAIRPKSRSKSRSKATNPHAQFVMAKDFLNSAGGLKQAKGILELVSKLIS
jgi:hypothetical protein